MKHPELLHYDMGPGVVAFSTTRRGGYGVGAYGEFNINPYCGDDAEAVGRNWALLCRALGIADDRLLLPHQTHQTAILPVDEHFLALPADERQRRLEGIDAVMTRTTGLCIGVSTADCIPLLLHDPEHRAVCAVHAGWRGTVGRIAERAVDAMRAAYGTCPGRLRAVVGPGISLESFEVGDEVYEAFAHAGFCMAPISRRMVNPVSRQERWHLDLPECNRRQLLAAGVASEHIAMTGICTYQQHERYFSARRLGILSGRLFTGIMLKQPAPTA